MTPLPTTLADKAGSRTRRVWQHLAVVGLYCVLTAVMVSPLVRNPGTVTAGWEGDNTFCIRQFWWVKRAIVDLNISPFVDPDSYFPGGHDTANGELFFATTIPAIPITMLWGPVVAYNITLLLTFVLTGFGTYLWIQRLTGSAAAGIVAGIVAMFMPYRFAHLPGHLHMMSTHWVPWALYAFERFLERKRLGWSVGLGVAVALVALSSWYYAYAIALMLPVYALVRSRPWREHCTFPFWRGAVIAAATATLLVLPAIIPYLRIRSRGGLTRGLVEMEAWSLNFYDFFLPNSFNPWFSDFMLRWFPQQATQWVERGVALGFVALALAALAIRARRQHPAIAALLLVWAVSYLIALGPTLHSGDRPILLPVPRPVVAVVVKTLDRVPSLASVRDEILHRQVVAIPMPSLLLYAFVPMTSGMRVMARFGMWTGVMTAGLAGFGTWFLIGWLRRRLDQHQLLAVAVTVTVLGGLIMLESRSSIPSIELRPRAVDLWLAQQPRQAVVELPLEQGLRPFQDYYKTVHGQPTVFGPVGDGFFPPAFEARKAALTDFPSATSVAALRDWRVRHVLFTPSLIPDWPAYKQKVEAAPGLAFDREIDGVLVYVVQ